MLSCAVRRLIPFLIFLASLLFCVRAEASFPKSIFKLGE